MTLSTITTFKLTGRMRLGAFSLIEVMVSLTIMSMIVLSTLSVFLNMNRYLFQDRDVQSVIDYSEKYFFNLYFSDNLKNVLFQPAEISNFNRGVRTPVLLPPVETNAAQNIRIFINRKIERWDPLLVNIGMEAVITIPESRRTGTKTRHYWIETTLSENYLSKLK